MLTGTSSGMHVLLPLPLPLRLLVQPLTGVSPGVQSSPAGGPLSSPAKTISVVSRCCTCLHPCCTAGTWRLEHIAHPSRHLKGRRHAASHMHTSC